MSKTAIFIDGNWLYAISRRLNKNIDYKKLFNVLLKKFGQKSRIYYYGMIDPNNQQQIKFFIFLKNIGYIIRSREIKKIGNKFIPADLDIVLTIDIMRNLSILENIVLVSGDSDFSIVLDEARRNSINIYVVALPYSMGYLLRKTTKNFINLETLIVEKKTKCIIKETEMGKFISENYIRKGNCFESYIKLKNLIESAKKQIIIIDQYIDDQILLMVQGLKNKVDVSIITEKKKVTPADFFIQVEKMNRDGYKVKVCDSSRFHDRFVCVDGVCWHSGHSLKNLGERGSMFNKVNRDNTLNLFNDIKEIVNKN